MPSALACEPLDCAGMAADFLSLIFEVNDLIRRVVRGDLSAAEELAAKARLLENVCEEASMNRARLPSGAGPV